MANTTRNELLLKYWNEPVSKLASRPANTISDGLKERHRLFSLLAMASTHYFWNGDKRGKNGRYPLNVPVVKESSKYLKGDYIGHNILALAVDFDGRVADFEMNHNNIFNSSAEHAEARLVKRIFSLASLADTWNFNAVPQDRNDTNTFHGVSIYTTLESCSQCSGIMALAQVKEIIYLHTDGGMYLIGNILRNLTEGTKLESPNPVDGSEFDFEYFTELNKAFDNYASAVSVSNPFFISDETPSKNETTVSLTSFLCTKAAYDIYEKATAEFLQYIKGSKHLAFPDFKPIRHVKDSKGNILTVEAALTNRDVVSEVANFYEYVKTNGKRATPHK